MKTARSNRCKVWPSLGTHTHARIHIHTRRLTKQTATSHMSLNILVLLLEAVNIGWVQGFQGFDDMCVQGVQRMGLA